jgi:hypothetical protein
VTFLIFYFDWFATAHRKYRAQSQNYIRSALHNAAKQSRLATGKKNETKQLLCDVATYFLQVGTLHARAQRVL